MLLLKVKSLLEDQKLSIDSVANLISNNKTEEDFDKAVIATRNLDPSVYKTAWVSQGVNTTLEQVWEYLIRKHFMGLIASIVSSSVKKSVKDVQSNISALDEIIKATIQRVSSEQLPYGIELKALISKEVSDAYNSNRHKFAKNFDVKDRNHDVAPALAEVTPSRVTLVSDWEKALGPEVITPDQVRIIIDDITASSRDYKLSSPDTETKDYTMYESYLRTEFKFSLEQFNEDFKGYVKVRLDEHTSENKYSRYDSLMEIIYPDFVSKGISKDNINQVTNLILRVISGERFTVTSITPIYSFRPVSDEGRFGTSHELVSSDKYDRFHYSLLALSKLVTEIKKVGRSPFEINPLIFTDHLVNASNKFESITQLIKYSNTVIKVAEKYGFGRAIGEFDSVVTEVGNGLLVNNTLKNITIFNNRNKLKVADLSNSISGVIRSNSSSGEVVSEFPYYDNGFYVNIFTLARAMESGISPFISLMPVLDHNLDVMDFNPVQDQDLVYDQQLIENVLGISDPTLVGPNFDINNYDKLVDTMLSTVPEGDLERSKLSHNATRSGNVIHLAWLLDDLRRGNGIEKNVKIITGTYNFIDKVADFEIDFLSTLGDKTVTELDFDTAIYRDKLFEPLHEILDHKKVKTREDVFATMHALLKVYFPDLTVDDIKEFASSKVDTPAYEVFKNTLFNHTFSGVRNHFISASAGLTNLTTQGRSIRLSASDLEKALADKRVIDDYEDLFNKKFAHVKTDSLGYFIDAKGDLFNVMEQDGVVGALHSCGVFVFTDLTTRRWID